MKSVLRFIGNILWFILCGLVCGLVWIAAGIVFCITIIGIPAGKQCFKLAWLSFWPFGKEIEYRGISTIFNIIWILLPGLELALLYIAFGLFFYITIIGIPFGVQCFKLARLSLMPFGAKIVKAE